MQIIKIDPKNPSLKAIRLAAEVIRKGGVIIYPTDTIYGIGASALNQESIDKVYKIKKRPENKPLSIIIRDMKMAKKYCAIDKMQSEIFKAVFPGPFTLIFKTKSAAKKNEAANHFDYLDNQSDDNFKKSSGWNCGKDIFTGFKNTLSVRVPDCKITELLSKELGIPFTATSANISGLPGGGDIQKILKQFKAKKNPPYQWPELIDLVLDAGVLPKKNPSTIIDLTGKNPKIIRK